MLIPRAVLAAALTFTLVACGSDDDPVLEGDGETSTTVATGDPTITSPMGDTSQLKADLAGTKEVGQKGDEDGKGTFTAGLQPGPSGEMFCYDLEVTGVADVVAAHIHKGTATENGDIVVPLATPEQNGDTWVSGTCPTVEPALRDDILASPANYYVNVHSKAFPAGAARGNLERI